jgi:hypothetical protein
MKTMVIEEKEATKYSGSGSHLIGSWIRIRIPNADSAAWQISSKSQIFYDECRVVFSIFRKNVLYNFIFVISKISI